MLISPPDADDDQACDGSSAAGDQCDFVLPVHCWLGVALYCSTPCVERGVVHGARCCEVAGFHTILSLVDCDVLSMDRIVTPKVLALSACLKNIALCMFFATNDYLVHRNGHLELCLRVLQ